MMDDEKAPPSDDAIFDSAIAKAEAEPAPAPAAAPPASPEPASERPRDEKGRFAASSTESQAPPAEAPVSDPDAPPAPAPTAEGPETTSAPEGESLAAFPPFTYQALDRDYTLPGSHVGTDGVLLTAAEGVPALRSLLAQAHENRARMSEMGRQMQQARREVQRREHALQAQSRQNAEVMKKLIAIGTDPDELAAWAADAAGSMETLRLRAELEVEKQQRLAIEQERQQEVSESRARQRQTELPRQVDAKLREYEANPAFAGFDRQRVYERIMGPLFRSVFSAATEDDVRDGLAGEVGEVMVDYDVLEDVLRWDRPNGSAPAKPAASAPAAAPKAAPPPPVVSATQAPPPRALPPRPDLRGKKAKDVDDYIFGAALDEALSR